MKNIYVKVESNDDEKKYVWIKLIMNYINELSLDNIVMSVNQMLINKRPIKVFFEYPNILFEKESPVLFVNHSSLSKVKEITTKDQEVSYDIHFTSYQSLKDTIYGMIGQNEQDKETKTTSETSD